MFMGRQMVSPVTAQRSAWLRSAAPLVDLPTLDADLVVETVIIGAGYAGLNAAIRLAEHGREAVVLEAEEPGFGASGRNGGQVIAGLKYDPQQLIAMFGERRGRLLAEFAGGAASLTFDLIDRYQLQCHAQQSGWLQPAVDEKSVALVTRRARMWADFAGVAVRILDARETREATGTDFYKGAWVDPRGGQLQPLAYARELARIATSRGARVFRRSAVARLERGSAGWSLTANNRTVRAEAVLVCTNGYTESLLAKLQRSYFPASSIICSTAPLPDRIRREIMPAGLPISDARRLLNYIRFDPDGRFMIGARGSFGLHEPVSYFDRLRAAARKIFPALEGATWEDAWGGRFALTRDHLPHIHNPEPGLFAVLGCNGRGVAMLSQLGRLAADLRTRELAPEDSPLALAPISAIPLHGLRRPGLEIATLYYRTLDWIGA
jgi:glycine/D-amino acid oxidase-like deaminating enzyme